MKFLYIGLFAIATFVAFVFVVTLMTSPFVKHNEEGRHTLATILGYVSIVSLSSILVTVLLTVFAMECINFYFERELNILRDIKSFILWISGVSGAFAALGFLAAALVPVVWWAKIDYKDVGMYTGSVLLSSSAVGGVIGMLLGLASAPYSIGFFNEQLLSKNKRSRWEMHVSAFGPGVIFMVFSWLLYIFRVDAVHRFYSFGSDLLASEEVSDCDVSGRADASIAVACVTKDLTENEATIRTIYYTIIIFVILVCVVYRYVKSGKIK